VGAPQQLRGLSSVPSRRLQTLGPAGERTRRPSSEQPQALKERAHSALASAEERALREFVIGRLRRAIGLAWHRLFDWNQQVNRKMRTAAASSGVGVQVRIGVRDDLSAATRTVYELALQDRRR
jgi:hypothetical protein